MRNFVFIFILYLNTAKGETKIIDIEIEGKIKRILLYIFIWI